MANSTDSRNFDALLEASRAGMPLRRDGDTAPWIVQRDSNGACPNEARWKPVTGRITHEMIAEYNEAWRKARPQATRASISIADCIDA